jgi:hypothetical protein
MIEKSIVNLLLADTGTAAVVGTKIYPNRTPQIMDITSAVDPGLLPRIWLFRVPGTTRARSRDGAAKLTFSRTQINMDAANYEGAVAIREAVLAASNGGGMPLNGWTQTVMAGGVLVQYLFLEGDGDAFEVDIHGDNIGIQRITMDALAAWYQP